MKPIRFSLLCLLCACGGTSTNVDSGNLNTNDSGTNDAGTGDGGTPLGNGIRQLDLVLDGDPNGLIWVPETQTLYLADNHNNRVLTWTDDAGLGAPIALPAAPSNGAGLGQISRAPDGTLLVTRFGFGTTGAIIYVNTDGGTGLIPDLDVTKRRIGVTIDGTDIYDTYFTTLNGGHVGAIAKVTLDGGEVDESAGLMKPVGLVVKDGTLYASDQDQGAIMKCTLPACADLTKWATLMNPDLLSQGPNGIIYSGNTDGNVYQVATDGTVTTLGGTFLQPRGTSYDPVNKRLFIADHDPAGLASAMHIVPID